MSSSSPCATHKWQLVGVIDGCHWYTSVYTCTVCKAVERHEGTRKPGDLLLDPDGCEECARIFNEEVVS